MVSWCVVSPPVFYGLEIWHAVGTHVCVALRSGANAQRPGQHTSLSPITVRCYDVKQYLPNFVPFHDLMLMRLSCLSLRQRSVGAQLWVHWRFAAHAWRSRHNNLRLFTLAPGWEPKACKFAFIHRLALRGTTVISLQNVLAWCVFVRASLHMRREEKPTRCHWIVYCTYNMLNMFRALLCPSSGDRDCVCYYLLWCAMPCLLVVGGQVQGNRLCVRDEGCCSSNIPHSERIACYLHLTSDSQQPSTAHHRR